MDTLDRLGVEVHNVRMGRNPQTLYEHPAGVRLCVLYGRVYAEERIEGQWREFPLRELEERIRKATADWSRRAP